MKLSKQERIAILIIAVVILLGLGIFLFIVPKFEAIGISSVSLINKQLELQNDIDRAAKKEQLGEDVINAYNDGRNIADMFFEEMQPYEADEEVRNFIKYCNDNGVKVAVDSLSINTPSVSTLGVSFYTEPEVTYDLKTYATQGQIDSEEKVAEQNRTALLQANLASTQTVGSIDVSFNVTVLSDEDMLKFVDIINNYNKQEESGAVRKAMRLSSGYSFTDTEVQAKYAEYIADITKKSASEASKLLAKDTGKNVSGSNAADTDTAAADTAADNTDNANNNDNKNDKTTSFEENTRQMAVTLTLYSIERMADPTDQLAAQNAQ